MSLGVSLSIILWVVTVLGFIVWNLYQKNKKMEELLQSQDFYISSVYSTSSDLESIIHKIDTTMWVQSDPELSELFENIKNLNAVIKRLTKTNGN